ncbi:hypothetical protein SEUCBS140593_002603 [Sporothrix eucalyptigena]|uniref:Uncharacterized protein n=1 Tax=Sporothrix eucalyptigena TaxID=1812306 RepID=A0ABP0B8K6_9PEZI
MADGTYGSPYYQGNMTPADGNKPTNNFATNMARKKTRKWVEAKKINYDGSGWGDEDDEDDGYDEEPLPPIPSSSAAPMALPSQQPATRNLPSSLAPGAGNRRTSPSPGRMPLNVQTQQQPPPQQQQQHYPPPQQQQQQAPWRQASPGPGNMAAPRTSSQMRATSPGGVGAVNSPRSGSQPPGSGTYSPWREGRSESPLGPRGQSPAGAAGAGPRGPRNMSPAANGAPGAPGGAGHNGPRGNFIRPSEIYKRAVTSDDISSSRSAGEAVERGRKEQPVAPATSAIPAAAAAPAPFIPQPDNNNSVNTTPAVEQPQSQHKSQDSIDSIASVEGAANERRYSTSPKLPDLARFSTFSPELLFGGSAAAFLSSDAPPVPSIPNSPAVGAFPAEGATSTPAAPPTSTLATVTETVGSTPRNESPFSTSSGGPVSAPIRDSAATATTAVTASSLDDTNSTAAGGVRGSADSTPSSVDVLAAAADSRKSSPGAAQALLESTATASNAAEASAEPQSQLDPTIAKTAPLNPHRLSSMVPFMPPSVTTPMGPRDMQRTGTMSSLDNTPTTTTNSPVKESDMLREEIIRTLSPVKTTHSEESMESVVAAGGGQQRERKASSAADESTSATAANTSDEASALAPSQQPSQQSRSDHTRTLTRESSYLQDVYDDYWTPDDASGNEPYTASDPPPPVPPLAGTGSGSAPGAAAAAVAAGAAVAGAAAYASASSTSPSTDNNATPQPSAPEPQRPSLTAPAPTQSPVPSVGLVPGAFPSSTSPVPAASQSAFSKPPTLRRRFSWEADPEPEEPAAETGTGAFTAVSATQMAQGLASLPSQQHLQQQPQPAAAADIRTQSPPPPAAALQMSSPMSAVTAPETHHTNAISPHPDTNTSVSAVSTSTVAPELVAPSPVSDAVAGATTSATTAADEASSEKQAQEPEAPRAQTQAPVRSMLDVGDAPVPAPVRSMLDVGDEPAPQEHPANRISTVESVQSATSIPSVSQPLSPSQVQPVAQPYAPILSPGAAPSIQVYQPDAIPAAHIVNPALFGSGNEGTGQFLTLRQCMAFDSHHERMAKLAETRRQYALADSGLSSWLLSMTAAPEYSQAAYVPLFDGHVSGTGPHGSSSASRPVAAVAATISRVPHHVHAAVPSGTQITNKSKEISHKSKEIFSVATGKAGKGLQALRKKGFHKKSTN